MTSPLRPLIRLLIARTAGRLRYQRAYQVLHDVSLRGMNYRSGDLYQSGEIEVIHDYAGRYRRCQPDHQLAIFDVGANVGSYSEEWAAAMGGLNHTIFAF